MSEDTPVNKNTVPLLLDGVRVLCVEANSDICDLLRIIFEKSGAKVVTVPSVAEGLDAIKKLKPDVLVAEIALPGEDGYSLIRKVRQLPPEEGGQTPALALTVYAYPEERPRALSAGYQEYMTKPFDLEALVSTVAALAGRAGTLKKSAAF